jgi:hypothetical protein
MYACILQLTNISVVEAKNLEAKDISGTSDPYCIASVDGGQSARSKIKKFVIYLLLD